MTNYPKKTLETLQKISKQNSIPLEELETQYKAIFDSDFLSTDEGVLSDEDRHVWATMSLWNQYKAAPPNPEHQIITAGYGGIRMTSTNKLQGELYAIVNNGRESKLSRIVSWGKDATLFDKVTLPVPGICFGYKDVQLGKFKDGEDYIADYRSVFRCATPIEEQDILELLERSHGAIRVPQLSEAHLYPSVLGEKGYSDKSDWRIVRGFISRDGNGENEDGTEWGRYNVTDLSLGDDDSVTTEGILIRETFTVWLSPKLMNYSVNSMCDFSGTIYLKEDSDSGAKEAQMQGFLVLPTKMAKAEKTN